MRVGSIRINGLRNPVGYAFHHISVSWKVTEAGEGARRQILAKIEVAEDPAFRNIVLAKTFQDPDPRGTELKELLPLLAPRRRYAVRVFVTTDDGETAVSAPIYYFETGKRLEPWKAVWIGEQEEDSFHPVFTKTFHLEKRPERGRLYISGLGMYVAYLNGRRIGDEVLTPYYSDYHREIQYQTFDVTDLLERENRIEIVLGDGWYKGAFGLHSDVNNWGSRFMTIAELHVDYADGTDAVVATDESWTYHGSDITVSGIYDGETVDHTLWRGKENPKKQAVRTAPEGRLVERYAMPVTEREILKVQDILTMQNGDTVLDFGQNFAGYVTFYNRTPEGTRILFDTAEILQDGNFYNENYRSARSQFEIISDGKEGWVTPDFTYFGFRYLRVKMWEKNDPEAKLLDLSGIRKDDFVGKALYSAMERTGYLTTGNAKVNRLYENALWGQKSNSIDFPTDCPQRDERLGWCGDTQVFSGTASYNMLTAPFYARFLHDIRLSQKELGGIVPGVLPVFDKKSAIYSSVWGDIGTILPSVLYEHFGDLSALREAYPIMKDWVDRITEDDKRRGRQYLFNWGAQLGDWLALDGRTSQSMSGGTDEYFIGSCYYAMSAALTAEAARALGNGADWVYYEMLHDRIKEAVIREYYSASGRLCIDTQTGYIVALYTGIYPDKEKVIEGLKTRLYKDCYRLKSGFVGAPIFCRVLADNGMEEEAYRFLLNRDFPGWLHCVDLGATTIWERWNSVLDDGRLSGTMMNSLNHYAFGAVVEFLYRNAAGLTAKKPGFAEASIAPLPNAELGKLDLALESASGTWKVFWEIEKDGRLTVRFTVPFGCTASVLLPYSDGSKDGTYEAGDYAFTYQPTRDFLARYSEDTLFKEMKKDPEAMEIIRKDSPLLLFFLDQEDYQYESLKTLGNMFYMGFTGEMIDALKRDLLALRRTVG